MAICKCCERDMLTTDRCDPFPYDDFGDGKSYARIPYDGEKCHDCGVTNGNLHHPGCDMERCPKCGGQAISCDCVPEEEDHSHRFDEEGIDY